MATIHPFRAWRFAPAAGDPSNLLTQPYDKISPEMQERYFSLSSYNLAHVIRGRSLPSDSDSDNVYTRAAAHLEDWIASGVMVQEREPALFAYFQKFQEPESSRTYLRKGLIALGEVEDYSRGMVYRHELTHSGPKRDRLELLRHTRAHFGQLFMLYDDPLLTVDTLLDRAASGAPLTRLHDEYGAEHSLWPIRDTAEIERIRLLLAPHKLLIADGHHRYETAIAFRDENPGLAGARRVMMTLVNMASPGLLILPTHRVVAGLPDFDVAGVLRRAREVFQVEELPSLDALRARLSSAPPGRACFGGLFQGHPACFAFAAGSDGLDVASLHDVFLARVLSLPPEAVRDERHIRYIRGFQAAAGEVANSGAQAAFFLRPLQVRQVADVALAGGVMPQKSTDFYPKLLSGMTIYRLEE